MTSQQHLCEELSYDQPTAPLAGTLPKSGDGTRSEKADGDSCRTKSHPAKPEQESTRCSGKQGAKGE
jgi:hypothetical protein